MDTTKTKVAAKKEKLAIVGCSDSKRLTPFTNSNYDFWGVNNLFLTIADAPWSGWFELHDITFDGANWKRREQISLDPYVFRGQKVNDYLNGLAKLKCPVYMQKKNPLIPNSVEYPIKEIVDTFGTYITNTISFEIALAIYYGYKKIDIYGVDMAVHSEYGYQRPSCEYFIGLAIGMGIEVYIPGEADLLKSRFVYAFEENKEHNWVTKVKAQILAMKQRLTNAQMQKDKFARQEQQYIGAIGASEEQIKIWESCHHEDQYAKIKGN